jgi:hypothetical protein
MNLLPELMKAAEAFVLPQRKAQGLLSWPTSNEFERPVKRATTEPLNPALSKHYLLSLEALYFGGIQSKHTG